MIKQFMFGTIISCCKAFYHLMWIIFLGQELSVSTRILLTILERKLPLVKRKDKHLDS